MSYERIQIKTSVDILSRPGYRQSVDPAVEPLKRIIQHYYLSSDIQCGLKNCRQWHKEGYLVELNSGSETNIGHVCGKRFGDKFLTEEKKYQEQVLRPKLIEKLNEAKPNMANQVVVNQDLNARASIVSTRKITFKKHFPSIALELERRSQNNRVEVFEAVARSEHEIEESVAANSYGNREKLRYKEVSRGVFKGLGVFAINIRETVFLDFINRIDEFVGLEVGSLPTQELIKWEIWLSTFEEVSLRAQQAVKDGEQFFIEENLKLLMFLPASNETYMALGKLSIHDLDNSTLDRSNAQKKKQNRADRRKQQFAANERDFKRSA